MTNITTIIVPIASNRTEDLRTLLTSSVNPSAIDPVARTLVCRDGYAFGEIKALHFCAFVILPPAVPGQNERLVFEATFDDDRDSFYDALLRVMPAGVDTIFRHCVGYPAMGSASPQLVKDYFAVHDVGFNTFYSGSPGRRVSRIRAEHGLRDALVEQLASARPETMHNGPSTLAGFQQLLQQRVLEVGGDEPRHAWAADAAPEPWEVVWGSWIIKVVGVLVVLAASIFGAAMLHSRGCGVGCIADHVDEWLTRLLTWSGQYFGDIGTYPGLRAVPAIAVLTLMWLGFRFVELVLDEFTANPHRRRAYWQYPLQIMVALRYAVLAAIISVLLLSLLQVAQTQVAVPDTAASPVTATLRSFDKALVFNTQRRIDIQQLAAPPASIWTSLLLLAVTGIGYAVLSHLATSLKLIVQFAEMEPRQENSRRFTLDAAHFCMVLAGLFACLIVLRHFPDSWIAFASQFFSAPVKWLVAYTVAAFAGILALYVLVGLFFGLTRFNEWRDSRNYADPESLVDLDFSGEPPYAREEIGPNTYQNYLASITEVKPGWSRLALLRTMLFAINVLARFLFNRGELGSIPTILSARWVLIDGGRRLLFLDNYSGAWESYLNEFIDMPAVEGLNSIWTNTFIRKIDCKSGREVSFRFPLTEYFFWRGAQREKPFKAYVRHSQLQTLAWYGAYPTLNTKVVNANTAIRQALFEPLAEHEFDVVVQKL